MTKDTYIIILICGLLIVCLVIILYNTYIYKQNIELFDNYTSKLSSVAARENDQITVVNKENMKDALHMLGYLKTQITDDTFEEIQKICHISSFEYDSVSKNDLYQRIADNLNVTSLQIRDEFIENPVYVIICKDQSTDTSSDVLIGTVQVSNKVLILHPSYYVNDIDESLKLSKYKNGEGLTKLKGFFSKNVILEHNESKKCSDKNTCIIYKINHKSKIFNNFKK